MKAYPIPVMAFIALCLTALCYAPASILKFSPVISFLIFWGANFYTDMISYDSYFNSTGNFNVVPN